MKRNKIDDQQRVHLNTHTQTLTKGTIDCTPKWEGLVQVMLDVYSENSSQYLKDEFKKMAQAADKWNEHCKKVN